MSNETAVIHLPDLGETLTKVWHLLFDLGEGVPDVWCLIGGLMVALYGIDHGRTDTRPTADGDVLVDIHADPSALREISNFLTARDLRPDLAPDGIVHRFIGIVHSDEIVIDVLAPDHVGERADLTTTPGGRTIEVPGGTQALSRTEDVKVHVGGRTGRIRRPNLVGAILIKLAAQQVAGDTERHFQDLAFLLSLVPDPMAARPTLTGPERRKLHAGELADRTHPAWNWLTNDHASAGHAALRLLAG